MTYDQLMVHFQTNWTIYAGVAVVLAPVAIIFRKWSVPIALWAFEALIYSVILHIIVHYTVALINWFKFESQMKMLVEQKVNMNWETPLVEFWRKESYNPQWVIFFEAVAVIAIIALVLKMRPMKVQKIKPKAPKRPGQPGYLAQQQQRAGQAGRGPGKPRR